MLCKERFAGRGDPPAPGASPAGEGVPLLAGLGSKPLPMAASRPFPPPGGQKGPVFFCPAEAPLQAARREASPIPASKRVPAAQTARDRIKMVKKPMGTRVKRAENRSWIPGFREQRPVFRSR